MAGMFFYCLDRQLRENSTNDRYTVSRAYSDTLDCVWENGPYPDRSYGPNALKYVLLGNGSVRLCLPSGDDT